MSNIQIVIEVQEATAFTIHPIMGASGKTYGHAMYDQQRGTMCMRMSLEEWRAAKADLCLAHRPFYGLVYDFEVVESQPDIKVTEEAPLVKKLTKLRRSSSK